MKIVMLEDLNVEEKEVLKYKEMYEAKGDEFIPCFKKLSLDEKVELVQDADVVIIGKEPYCETLVKNSKNVKFLSVGFTGVNHLDESIYKTDIKISNASGYATIATAELTLAMMLNTLRNTVEADRITRDGKCLTNIGSELHGKVVGLVGCGNIGAHVAKILNAFGAKLLFFDTYRSEELEEIGIYTTLDTLVKTSDIISIHCPLNDDTMGMFNYELFELMKSDAILINCARGPIVNSSDLVRALNNKLLAKAGLDVFDMEPPLNKDYELLNHKNIIVSPHIAYETKESMLKRLDIVFNNIDAFINNKQINIIKE